jgi:hypothetical protein
VDFRIAHALDASSARHDGFEDVLGAHAGASELLFLAVVVAMFLLLPRRRSAAWRRPRAPGSPC